MIAEGQDTPTKLAADLAASRTLTPADWLKHRRLGSLPSSERKPWTPTAAMRLLGKLREREQGCPEVSALADGCGQQPTHHPSLHSVARHPLLWTLEGATPCTAATAQQLD